MYFPPSPAFSDCDSLDGIEDLDAYLALQGPISGLPTPPMDKGSVACRRTAVEVAEDAADHARVTALFVNQLNLLTCSSNGTPVDKALIQDILVVARERTSREVCIVAFNILCELQARAKLRLHSSPFGHPPDLLLKCAVLVASDFLEDAPMSARCWSEARSSIYHRRCWSKKSIEDTKRELLYAIDWRIHSLSTQERVEHTLAVFVGEAELSCCQYSIGSTSSDDPFSLS